MGLRGIFRHRHRWITVEEPKLLDRPFPVVVERCRCGLFRRTAKVGR